jgi:hypothetical protein
VQVFATRGHRLSVDKEGVRENVYQYIYIKVEPSTRHQLPAFMATSGITTDSGPRLEVRDAYDPGALDQLTSSKTGDSNGRSSVLLDFTTGPKTELVFLSPVRLPSQKSTT